MIEKKKIDILFIIQPQERGQKDIDHYLPFFYFLSKVENLSFNAKGIIFDNKINFSNYIDERFKFLSDLKNVDIDFAYNDNILDKIKYFLMPKSRSPLSNFTNRVINKIFNTFLKYKYRNLDLKKKLSKNFLFSDSPLIFSTNSNFEQLEIVSKIKKFNLNAKWISLPHGTAVCDNRMVLETQLEKQLTFPKGENEVLDKIDYLLLTSQKDKDNKIRIGLTDTKKAIIIGSPIFFQECLQIKKSIKADGKSVKLNSNFKVKILFLVPKKHINIFSEELVRTIDFISSFQEIELILSSYKNHLPKFPKHLAKRENIRKYLVAEEYSSSQLIDWADIIFHAGTGIVFESFMKNKITVLPRYLTCNTLISEKYNAGINLKNRDELRVFCNQAVSSLKDLKAIYNEKYSQSNKNFVDDYVFANSKSVPENIKESLIFISNKFNN